MKYLILGKKITSEGVKKILRKNNIDYDCLNTEEVDIDNIKQYDLVIKSPGIKYDLDLIRLFEKNRTEVISDIELIYRMYNKYLIGVTGTNGKTSCSYYINDLLNYKYFSTACGNIGISICDAIIDEKKYDFYVCELSSFMLNNTKKFRPNITVFLNINKAHIDFHNTFKNYVNAKCGFLHNLRVDDVLIYNKDDLFLSEYTNVIQCKKYSFSAKNNDSNCRYDKKNGIIFFENKKVFKYKNKDLSIVVDNILPSVIVAKIMHISDKEIAKYFNHEIRKIKYRIQKVKKNIYNDSKSTNPNATLKALEKKKNF